MWAEIAFAVGVRLDRYLDSLKDFREILVAVEEDHSNFGVTPAAISQELVNGLGKLLWTTPELALRDKDVSSLRTNQDIGLSLVVERFTSRLSFVVPIQLDQEMRPQGLLVHRNKCGGAPFHHNRHVLDHPEDVLIVGVRESRFGFKRRATSFRHDRR